MHKNYRNFFTCPHCNEPLELNVFSQDENELLDGLFFCPNQHHFPLIDGLPRFLDNMLLGELVNQHHLKAFLENYHNRMPKAMLQALQNNGDVPQNTGSFYTYMWSHYDTEFDKYDQYELERLTGNLLDFNAYANKTIIDVGGGMGRFVVPFLESNAKHIVCMDLGESIVQAYKKYRHKPQVLCVQADLYKPPFLHFFDLVVNIGVLQHLPDPSKGFHCLVNLTKPSGDIFAWVYGQSSIRFPLLLMRKLTRSLSLRLRWWLSAALALLRYIASKLGGSLATQEGYGGYSFRYLHVNTFDHLATPIINFFSASDISSWMKTANIADYELIERSPGKSNASWVIRTHRDTPDN